MKSKILIIITVVIILLISIILLTNKNDKKIEKIDKKVINEKITFNEMDNIFNNGIIIDVRTEEEYSDGHIENSVNIPLDNISDVINHINDKDTQIFVYCRSGVRSSEAAIELVKLGYIVIYDLGGILESNVTLVKE